MNQQPADTAVDPVQRVRVWYALLLVVFGLFALRVFYLQVIRYDYYKKAAASDQLKQYVVPAQRGTISAQLGESTVPIVLNQKLYTLYADPTVVKKADQVAAKLQPIIGGNTDDIKKQLTTDGTRYVVLAKKLTPAQSAKILAYKFAGVGTLEQDYRTYPQGDLAAQLLGFVNDAGRGEYGVEQALNSQLAGKPGQLKAVTDINGVPLAANGNNLSTEPVPGSNVDLTLNVGMQAQLEKIIQDENKTLKAKSINALIMDPNTGAIKAMANTPTYDPANYQAVSDASVFTNGTTSNAIETGSIMKLLTTAAAINTGAITPQSAFYDPGSWTIDGSKITDVEYSTGEQSVGSVLNLSLNTGATWMLMQMGGGEINAKARNTWYDYMTKHFLLGQTTGIEQGYENPGYIPLPAANGAAIDLTYANTSFGQAITATPVQMAAAISSVLNGGTYYQPHLVKSVTSPSGKTTVKQPKVVEQHVVSPQTSADLVNLMEYVIQQHIQEGFTYLNFGPHYIVGGKTGTAQIALPTGGYDPVNFNGTYAGFIGGDKPQYVVLIYTVQPQVHGFAGTQAGQVLFNTIAHMLVNDFGVTPKSH